MTMSKFNDFATFRWLGKPNPYGKDTEPYARTEAVRKAATGKTTVAAFCKAVAGSSGFATRDPRKTLATLVGQRLIEIEGYAGRAVASEMEDRYDELYNIVE